MYPIYQKDLDKLNKYIKKYDCSVRRYTNWYIIKEKDKKTKADKDQVLEWVHKKYPQYLELLTSNKYYIEIDNWLTRWENGFEDSFETKSWVADRIVWAYRYKHITKEEMQSFASRMTEIFKGK